MCWNEKVSLLTFILGTIFCIIGYRKTKDLFYLFFQCVIFVQLGEAFIWYDINCGNLARLGTIIAFFAVWLQPIFGLYMVDSKLYTVLIIFYIFSSLKIIYKLFTTTTCYKPICDTNSLHLSFTEWNHFHPMGILYAICILYLLFILYKKSPVISIYLFITMILSSIFYKNTFGSMWCWFAAFTPILAMFYF